MVDAIVPRMIYLQMPEIVNFDLEVHLARDVVTIIHMSDIQMYPVLINVWKSGACR